MLNLQFSSLCKIVHVVLGLLLPQTPPPGCCSIFRVPTRLFLSALRLLLSFGVSDSKSGPLPDSKNPRSWLRLNRLGNIWWMSFLCFFFVFKEKNNTLHCCIFIWPQIRLQTILSHSLTFHNLPVVHNYAEGK